MSVAQVGPVRTRGIGEPMPRVEARDKVTGHAPYAVDHPVPGAVYAWPVQAAFAKGRVTSVDTSPALAVDGVLTVLWHANAPRLQPAGDPGMLVLQGPEIRFHGQIVALVVATSLESAREGADAVVVHARIEPADTVLRTDHPGLYHPEVVNAGYVGSTAVGDFDAGFEDAPVRVDATYRTPAEHHNPMEPHATTAFWERGHLVVFDSSQSSSTVKDTLAGLFELPPQLVRVVNEHVGGGFGSKGTARVNAVLAAMASRQVGRPVKLAMTRKMLFSTVGYRTPTIQRIRLGADLDGRLVAIAHDAVSQTSKIAEFVEQSAVISRIMYAAPNRATSHRVVALDVPPPIWMRAPGESPGSFALESAIDELAVAGGWDPVRLRIDNDTRTDPEEGMPFSSRHLVECLREGAERFGWEGRDPRPAIRREGQWLIGTGVAASTFPAITWPSTATVRATADDHFDVEVNGADIGTGARTVLRQIAADALGVALPCVEITVGDSDIGPAPVAGGSMGTSSWGWAVTKACRLVRERIDRDFHGRVPSEGVAVRADTTPEVSSREPYARHAFGAQFCEVRVDAYTGEIRVGRLLGMFAAGRIVNPTTARSQLLGGMTMGLSMALLEQSIMDSRTGDYVTDDLASYHVAVNADVPRIEVGWLDEDDPHLNPMGSKGIGELGIVGTAAAVANAVYHATGIRVRKLPITIADLLQ
ncbi:xanthine dehydrogenase family protein molybdopterin-binding subunit [Dactylosporangium fulvum]|uniref:Xanthine dehydrogenase family protein molybdopterin-binding subunit n=1 Tax=Dactylosporangium fulvum TaxID=53359 RepID=A0ABY5VUL8_9ACTN|nr:xanthine dehydrogenase family protein molybdopterin-binding subunit [Dactylosporangium fulvum]UWP80855.1 xanthine dehydrogenase family protein molybdopterin-binding subunit [Dactylosporangium fulvum]